MSLSCLAQAGENSWEIAKKELSNWRLLLSFLSNCSVQNSAETAVTWSRLSDWEMAGIFKFRICLKTSAIDGPSTRVFSLLFSSYITTTCVIIVLRFKQTFEVNFFVKHFVSFMKFNIDNNRANFIHSTCLMRFWYCSSVNHLSINIFKKWI